MSRMLTKLVEHNYIEILADTYGTHIKVCNYDIYQSVDTYKTDSCGTAAEQLRYGCVTGADTYNNVKNVNNDKNGKNSSRSNKKKFEPNSIPIILSNILLMFINSRNQGFKKPDIQKWALEIDKMIRLDNRIPCAIMNVICWSQANEFWQTNILSTGKLRKQFDTLKMKMLADTGKIPKHLQTQYHNAKVSEEWLNG